MSLGPTRIACCAIVALALSIARDSRVVGSETLPIQLGTFTYEPARLEVATGTSILLLTNVDVRRHDMVITTPTGDLESPIVPPGESLEWVVSIDQAGIYEYWCSVPYHRDRGMVGRLIVS
jgi:uncharacterized cupredoxin-like copper-binding protein